MRQNKNAQVSFKKELSRSYKAGKRRPDRRRTGFIQESIPAFIPYKDIESIEKETTALVPLSALRRLKPEKDRAGSHTSPDHPGGALQVLSTHYELKLSPGDSAILKAEIELEVFDRGYVTLPLALTSRAAVKCLFLDGKAVAPLVPKRTETAFKDRDTARLLLCGKGRHLLAYTILLRCRFASSGELDFAVLRSAISRLDVNIPGKALHVDITPSSGITGKEEIAGGTRFSCTLKPTDTVHVRWYTETKYSYNVNRKAVVSAQVYNTVSFNDGLLNLRAHIRFEITQAPLDTLIITPPAGLELLRITGPEHKIINNYQKIEGNKLLICLPSARQGVISLETLARKDVLDEMKTEGTSRKIDLSIPCFKIEDCSSSSCFIGLKLGKTLSPRYRAHGDFRVISARELPSWIPLSEKKGLDVIYKSTARNPIRLPLVSINDEKVRFPDSFRILNTSIATILTTENLSQTKARFSVINSKNQFLEIYLPKGSRLQSLFVDELPARAGLKKDIDDLILIPLIKSPLGRDGTAKQFPVELIFTTPIPRIGNTGCIQIETLASKERIDKLSWTIGYPNNRELVFSDGSLAMVHNKKRDLFVNVSSFRSSGKALTGSYPVRIDLPSPGHTISFETENVDTGSNERPWLSLVFFRTDYLLKVQSVVIILTSLSLLLLLLALFKRKIQVVPLLGSLFGLLLAALIDSWTSVNDTISLIFTVALSIGLFYASFAPVRLVLHCGSGRTAASLAIASLCLASGLYAAPLKIFIPYKEGGLQASLAENKGHGFMESSMLKVAHSGDHTGTSCPSSGLSTDIFLHSVDISGIIDERNRAEFNFTFSFSTVGKHWKKVPVIKAWAAIQDATLDGRPAAITAQKDHLFFDNEGIQNNLIISAINKGASSIKKKENPVAFSVLVDSPGRHILKLRTVLPVADQANSWKSLSFSLPCFRSRHLSCSFAGSDIKVEVPDACGTTTTLKNKTTIIDAYLPGVSRVGIRWFKKIVRTRARAMPALPDRRKKILPPLIFANIGTKILLDESRIAGTVSVHYQVERHAIQTLRISFPRNLTIKSLYGRAYKSFHLSPHEEEGRRILEILLKRASTGAIDIRFDFESDSYKSPSDTTGIIDIPEFRSCDTDFETGIVAIERVGNISLSPDCTSSNLVKADMNTIPEEYRCWLAYRYKHAPWKLALKITRYPTVTGYTTTVDKAKFRTILNRKGQGYTDAELLVRNYGQSFLNIEMAPGIGEFRSLTIDGKSENYLPSLTEGMIRIPLKKPSVEHDYAKNPMNIKFRFVHNIADKQLRHGSLKGETITLYLPRTNIPITGDGLTWSIKLPDNLHISQFNGPFDELIPSAHYGAQLFHKARQSAIRLRRAYLPPCLGDFRSRSDGLLKLNIQIRSRLVTRAIDVLAGALSLCFFSLTLLALMGMGRPWQNPGCLLLALISLAGLAAIEYSSPGRRIPVSVGLLLSPAASFFWLFHIRRKVYRSNRSRCSAAVALILLYCSPACVFSAEVPKIHEADFIFIRDKDFPRVFPLTERLMHINDSKFQAICDQYFSGGKKDAPTADKEQPPGHVIEAVEYSGRVDGDLVRFTANYRVLVFSDKAVKLKLPSDSIAPLSVSIDGKDAVFYMTKDENRGIWVEMKKAGLHTIEYSFAAPVNRFEDTASLSISCPRVPQGRIRLNIDTQAADVEIIPSIGMTVSRSHENRLLLEAGLPYHSGIFVRWSRSFEPRPREQNKALVFNSEQKVSISVKEAWYFCNTDIDYHIREGALLSLKLDIPRELDVIMVKGDNIQQWNCSDGILSVDLETRCDKFYHLKLLTCAAIPKETKALDGYGKSTILLSGIKTRRAVLEKGTLTVQDETDIQLSPGEATGLNNKGPFEYTFVTSDWRLPLHLVNRPEVEVTTIRIPSCDSTVQLNRNGAVLVRQTWNVINNGEQFLKVRLPKNSSLMSCFVDDSPRTAGGSTDADTVMIPLMKSVGEAGNFRPFQVEITFAVDSRKFSLLGYESISLASIPYPVQSSTARVLAPQGFVLTPWKGTMRYLSPSTGSIRELCCDKVQYFRKTVPCAGNGVMNAPPPRTMNRKDGRRREKPKNIRRRPQNMIVQQQVQVQAQKEWQRIQKGNLPVRIHVGNVENTGTLNFSQELLGISNRKPTIVVVYTHVALVLLFKYLVFLCGLVLWLLLFRRPKLSLPMISVLLVFCGYIGYVEYPLSALAPALLIYALTRIETWLSNRYEIDNERSQP